VNAALLVLLLLLVAATGFVAHRASLCTVRAVAEILNAGTAHMLASFFKAALWAALVYGLLLLVFTPQTAKFPAFEPRSLAIVGGFVFGIGAAINGGCSYSTLQRIADGDLAGLASIVGFVLGVFAWSTLDTSAAITQPVQATALWVEIGAMAPWLLAVLALLAAIEFVRLWRTHPRTGKAWQSFGAPSYRVGTAAAVIGVCAGLLYAILGAWSYTGTVRRAVDAAYRMLPGPNTLPWLLFAAMFLGMVASAMQRGSFALRWRPQGALAPRLGGGVLMGLGASLVPGGNDTLILTGLPALSGWAVAAYLALVAGVGAGLWVQHLRGKPYPNVACIDGICIERPR
jgi:uncharacterized membrane protein YedE/YeeE